MKCFLGPYATIVFLALTASASPLPAPAKSSLSAGRIDPDNSLSAPHKIFPDPNSSRTAAGDHAIAPASRSDQSSNVSTSFAYQKFNTKALLKGAHVAEDTPVDAYQHLIDNYRQRQQTVNNMATVLALQEALALLFLKEKQVNPYWDIRRQIEEVRDRKDPREEPQIQEYAKEISLRLRAVLVERQQKEPLVVSAVALAFELQYITDSAWVSQFDPSKLPERVRKYLQGSINAQTLVDLAATYEEKSLPENQEKNINNLTLYWQLWMMAARILHPRQVFRNEVNEIIRRIRVAQLQAKIKPSPVLEMRLKMMVEYLQTVQ